MSEITGIIWKAVAPPAPVGRWMLVAGPTVRPDWAEVDGWQPVAGGTFAVRYRDDGCAVVLGAATLEWRHGRVKRPWPRKVKVRWL